MWDKKRFYQNGAVELEGQSGRSREERGVAEGWRLLVTGLVVWDNRPEEETLNWPHTSWEY